MRPLKPQLIAWLATGCVAVAVISVLAHRRLHIVQPEPDFTSLLREVEDTTDIGNGRINLPSSLKPENAIDRLIDYMTEPQPPGTEQTCLAAMEALARIGHPAVPQLIQAIQRAPEKAASIPFANESTQPERFIRREAIKIQSRAALILGAIGDSRAVPVLTGLLSDPDPMRVYVKEAIAKIEESRGRPAGAALQPCADNEIYE